MSKLDTSQKSNDRYFLWTLAGILALLVLFGFLRVIYSVWQKPSEAMLSPELSAEVNEELLMLQPGDFVVFNGDIGLVNYILHDLSVELITSPYGTRSQIPITEKYPVGTSVVRIRPGTETYDKTAGAFISSSFHNTTPSGS